MRRLAFLPYLGAALLVSGGIALVLAVLVVPASLFPLVLAVAITAMVSGILCVVFGLLLPVFQRSAIPPAEVLGAATAAGRLAPARILSAKATGVAIGSTWDYAVDLVVAPTDRSAYRGTQYLRGPNPRTGLGAPGSIITVIRVDAQDPRVVMIKGVAETDQSQRVPQDAPAWRSEQ